MKPDPDQRPASVGNREREWGLRSKETTLRTLGSVVERVNPNRVRDLRELRESAARTSSQPERNLRVGFDCV